MGLLEQGQTFAGYHMAALINRGGMGEVWRAIKLGGLAPKEVVIKFILPQFAESEKFIQLFLSEVRIVSQLDHPINQSIES